MTYKIVSQWQGPLFVNNPKYHVGKKKRKKCILTRSKSSQADQAFTVSVLMCFNTAILCLGFLKIFVLIYS